MIRQEHLIAVVRALLICCTVLLLVAGCAGSQSQGPPEEDQGHIEATASGETTAYWEETTTHDGEKTFAVPYGETQVLQEEDILVEPPDSTLSYRGREVRRAPSSGGSVCWLTSEREACMPFDSGPQRVIRPKKKLYVPSGSEMMFRYEAPRPPNKVTAYAYPLLRGRDPYMGGARLGDHKYRPVVHGTGVERTIPAKLPPREYLVWVNVEDPQGWVDYPPFRIRVQ